MGRKHVAGDARGGLWEQLRAMGATCFLEQHGQDFYFFAVIIMEIQSLSSPV